MMFDERDYPTPNRPARPKKPDLKDFKDMPSYHRAMAEFYEMDDGGAYRQKLDEWRREVSRIKGEMKQAIIAEMAPDDWTDAQKDVIWNRAYDECHSSGMDEVAREYGDLVDFIGDFERAANKR